MSDAIQEAIIEDRPFVFLNTLEADAMRFHYWASLFFNELFKPILNLTSFLLEKTK